MSGKPRRDHNALKQNSHFTRHDAHKRFTVSCMQERLPSLPKLCFCFAVIQKNYYSSTPFHVGHFTVAEIIELRSRQNCNFGVAAWLGVEWSGLGKTDGFAASLGQRNFVKQI